MYTAQILSASQQGDSWMPTLGIQTRKRPVRRMNSAHRQLEIVNAAFDCIATTGHLSLSTTELAYKVGISQPAIFRHFRSKQQLHQAILDEANQNVIEELKLLIGKSELWNNPLNLLQDVAKHMASSFEQAPGVWLTLICQRSIAAEADISDKVEKVVGHKCAITQLTYALERLCVAAIEHGQLSNTAKPTDISHSYLALLFGMGQLWLNNSRDFDLHQRVDFAVKSIVAGYLVDMRHQAVRMSAIA